MKDPDFFREAMTIHKTSPQAQFEIREHIAFCFRNNAAAGLHDLRLGAAKADQFGYSIAIPPACWARFKNVA